MQPSLPAAPQERIEREPRQLDGPKPKRIRRPYVRKVVTEEARKLFQAYVIDFLEKYRTMNTWTIAVKPGKANHLFFEIVGKHGIRFVEDLAEIPDYVIFDIAECLKDIPKKRFIQANFERR